MSDPYGDLTMAQRLLLNQVLNAQHVTRDPVPTILARLNAPEADKAVVLAATQEARR